MAVLAIELRDFSSAHGYLEKLQSLDSTNSKYSFILAVTDLYQNNTEKALKSLIEISNSDETDEITIIARKIIANEYIKEMKFNEAVSLLEKIV